MDSVVQEDAQLSRREREAIEKERARQEYQRLHAAGKTEEARADLARLAVIRKQREDAAKKREEEKKSKFYFIVNFDGMVKNEFCLSQLCGSGACNYRLGIDLHFFTWYIQCQNQSCFHRDLQPIQSFPKILRLSSDILISF